MIKDKISTMINSNICLTTILNVNEPINQEIKSNHLELNEKDMNNIISFENLIQLAINSPSYNIKPNIDSSDLQIIEEEPTLESSSTDWKYIILSSKTNSANTKTNANIFIDTTSIKDSNLNEIETQYSTQNDTIQSTLTTPKEIISLDNLTNLPTSISEKMAINISHMVNNKQNLLGEETVNIEQTENSYPHTNKYTDYEGVANIGEESKIEINKEKKINIENNKQNVVSNEKTKSIEKIDTNYVNVNRTIENEKTLNSEEEKININASKESASKERKITENKTEKNDEKKINIENNKTKNVENKDNRYLNINKKIDEENILSIDKEKININASKETKIIENRSEN
jgi:hypothetical protein